MLTNKQTNKLTNTMTTVSLPHAVRGRGIIITTTINTNAESSTCCTWNYTNYRIVIITTAIVQYMLIIPVYTSYSFFRSCRNTSTFSPFCSILSVTV